MNRAIKFRGKCLESGEWLYGNLIQRIGRFPGIVFSYEHGGKIHYCEQPVKQETAGQFTGLHDKNGKEIYEGDILEIVNPNTGEHILCCVEWNKKGYYQIGMGNVGKTVLGYIDTTNIQLLGNNHDNPELLEKV